MKFVMLKKRPVPTGWEYTGSSARRRDVSETVCCRSSPCASRWSLTFWGLRSVPGDMFTLSVKPKGTLKSRPALLAAVFTYGHMLRCSLELGGGAGGCSSFPCSLLLGQQVPQACLARSISGPEISPPAPAPALAAPTPPAAFAQAGWGGRGALPRRLFTVLLQKPSGCAQLVVLLAQRIPVRLNDAEDTFVLLPNPWLAGSPSHRAFVLCWWSQKSLQDPECKCLCNYDVVME